MEPPPCTIARTGTCSIILEVKNLSQVQADFLIFVFVGEFFPVTDFPQAQEESKLLLVLGLHVYYSKNLGLNYKVHVILVIC